MSNLFYLSIFEEGHSKSDANSHYFYLASSNNDDPEASDTSSTAIAASIPNTASLASTASSLTPVEPITSTPIPPAPISTSSPAPSHGLTADVIIGFSIAIPLALIIGFGAGWFFFGRRRSRDQNVRTAPMPQKVFRGISYYGEPPSIPGYIFQRDRDKIYQVSQAVYQTSSRDTRISSGPYELPSNPY